MKTLIIPVSLKMPLMCDSLAYMLNIIKQKRRGYSYGYGTVIYLCHCVSLFATSHNRTAHHLENCAKVL